MDSNCRSLDTRVAGKRKEVIDLITKRQFLTVASIAVAFFLLGSMFIGGLMALGNGDGNPWERVWTAITGLQGRVDVLEEKADHVRTIRFHESDETANDQQTYKDGAIFVWTPSNSADNAILQIHVYFQYRCPGQGLGFRIVVNDETHPHGIGWLISNTYKWSFIYIFIDTIHGGAGYEGIPIVPNQNNYTIKFQFIPQGHLDTAYVKSINILLTVADGLPAES